MIPAGMVTPPASVSPSQAWGARQAATSVSSRSCSWDLQSAGRDPSGSGLLVKEESLRAAAVNAAVSASRWSSKTATGQPAQGVAAPRWPSSTPSTRRASCAAAGDKSYVIVMWVLHVGPGYRIRLSMQTLTAARTHRLIGYHCSAIAELSTVRGSVGALCVSDRAWRAADFPGGSAQCV